MAITLTGSVTGSAVTGLTSPTYTLSADTAPEVNAKQGAVTAFGGTQYGVTAHSLSAPFTLTYAKPRVFNSVANTIGGKVQMNRHNFITRKGVSCDSSSTVKKTALFKTSLDVPVGAESWDDGSLKAALSAHTGWLATHLDEIVAAMKSGVI